MALPTRLFHLALHRPAMAVSYMHVGTSRSPVDHTMTVRQDWRELAACIGQPELFFFDDHLEEAQAICGTCLVFTDCRVARIDYERITKAAHPGVWAGELWVVRNNVSMSRRARRAA